MKRKLFLVHFSKFIKRILSQNELKNVLSLETNLLESEVNGIYITHRLGF